jgi:hypothetical protein
MDQNSFAAAVHAEGNGAAARANFKQLRGSGGIWLQKGWTIRFTGSQNVGFISYMSVVVENVPRDQKGYESDTCWLKSDSIQDYIDQGDMQYPVQSTVVASAPAPAPATTELALPSLLQTYGTTDRKLRDYKWSNGDNTQVANQYQLPADTDAEEIHVMYSELPNGEKRVSDVSFHNFASPYTWGKIKQVYIPKDAVAVTPSEIGGNIEEVFTPVGDGMFLLMYRSKSLAMREAQNGVHACSDDSNVGGLLILNGEEDGDSVKDAVVTDAALHYCANSLMD